MPLAGSDKTKKSSPFSSHVLFYASLAQLVRATGSLKGSYGKVVAIHNRNDPLTGRFGVRVPGDVLIDIFGTRGILLFRKARK